VNKKRNNRFGPINPGHKLLRAPSVLMRNKYNLLEGTDRKFDPAVLALTANRGGWAPIQGLQFLPAPAFCPPVRPIRNARYVK
jgi:hypothetical protein